MNGWESEKDHLKEKYMKLKAHHTTLAEILIKLEHCVDKVSNAFRLTRNESIDNIADSNVH